MSNIQKYHDHKYFNFYMELAAQASKNSVAQLGRVGACIVLPSGMISLGWNGTPTGQDNVCEWLYKDGTDHDTGKTKPNVIHAEMNAIKKLLVAGVSIKDAILFTTVAPCSKCAVQLLDIGLKAVYYSRNHKNNDGLVILRNSEIRTYRFTPE